MTALLVVAVAVVVIVAACAVVLATRVYQRGSWLRIHHDAHLDSFHARTPVGSAEARLSVHEDVGRCYAVRTRFRGEPERMQYVPPTAKMVVDAINRAVQDNQKRRGITPR